MSIAGKHWYRFEFLKSDEWRDFRLQIITDCGGKCFCCRKTDPSSDVHHVWYGEPSYTGCAQFVVLCRECHGKIHSVLAPFKASSESERQEASARFNRLAEQIRSARKRHRRNGCRGCARSDGVLIIDPIRQQLCQEHGAGRIRLCPACFGELRASFKPLECGNSSAWKAILEFFDP